MKPLFALSSIVLSAGIVLTACSSQTNSVRESNFKLLILKENWFDLQIGYEAETAQAALSSANLGSPLFVVGTEQIENYDWDLQTITLTKAATDELGEALAGIEGTDPNTIARLKDLKESLGWGNPIESALYLHPFIVQTDNQFKYGGIFLDATSQMAIGFPVARVTLQDGKVVIALLPTHIPFVMIDPVDGNGELRPAVIAEEAQDDVEQIDFFPGWSADLAMSATSLKFRALIRDETIKLIVEAAGK